eukprot:Amastigsp_a509224_10.p6 type:complete len:100 gc:universal Amastigsp_a509224_10:723-424(-)
MSMPQNMRIIVTILPTELRGTLSPKPTVPAVIAAHQMPSQMPSLYDLWNSDELCHRSAAQMQCAKSSSPMMKRQTRSCITGEKIAREKLERRSCGLTMI